VRIVPLYGAKARGRFAFVSERDYALVMAYRWFVRERWRRGVLVEGPYAVAHTRRADGTRTMIFMHVLIMGVPGIDHRNRYPLDNTRWNLRKATSTENMHNRTATRGSTSDYVGVSWDRRDQRWHGRIRGHGTHWSGYFAVEEDAARARDAAACELHGAFVRFNFPEEHRQCVDGRCNATPVNSPRP
jgi:hypothetical protein